jgi:hypothetical protein
MKVPLQQKTITPFGMMVSHKKVPWTAGTTSGMSTVHPQKAGGYSPSRDNSVYATTGTKSIRISSEKQVIFVINLLLSTAT